MKKNLDLDYINSNFFINTKFYCIEKNTVYKIENNILILNKTNIYIII